MATSGRYHDSYATIRDLWSLDELYEAVDFIDALADYETRRREYEAARREARK